MAATAAVVLDTPAPEFRLPATDSKDLPHWTTLRAKKADASSLSTALSLC